eukprot:8347313-Pyramimonas_sp.AAC.1
MRKRLGVFRGPPGGLLGAPWGVLAASWGPLAASWSSLGPPWGSWGRKARFVNFWLPSWAPLGAVLEPSWA